METKAMRAKEIRSNRTLTSLKCCSDDEWGEEE